MRARRAMQRMCTLAVLSLGITLCWPQPGSADTRKQPKIAGIKDPIPLRGVHREKSPSYPFKPVSGCLFARGISGGNVDQGQLNDCFLAASMAAVAYARPDIIRRLMKPILGKKGWFHVFFRGKKGQRLRPTPVTPEVPHDGGRPLYAAGFKGKQFWPTLVEKAYAKRYGKGNGYEGLDKGGSPVTALARLTGGKTSVEALDPESFTDEIYRERLWWKLTQTLRANKPLVVASPDPKSNRPLAKGLVGPHGYVVTWAKKTKAGERMVYLFDPHNIDEYRGRYFSMTFEEFNKSFLQMQICSPDPQKVYTSKKDRL